MSVHECELCYDLCDCDCEDMEQPQPEDCTHVCEPEQDDFGDDDPQSPEDQAEEIHR